MFMCIHLSKHLIFNYFICSDSFYFQAWIVVICSFLCNGIIFGLINSYGAIYVALKNTYELNGDENSETKASFVGSLLVGSTFVLSPISGVLVDRFGIRRTAFIGGLIATIGVFLSSFFIDHVSLSIKYSLLYRYSINFLRFLNICHY